MDKNKLREYSRNHWKIYKLRPDVIKRKKEYYAREDIKKHRSEKGKIWYQQNKERLKIIRKKYRNRPEIKEHIKLRNKIYTKNKFLNNPTLKSIKNLKIRINKAIKNNPKSMKSSKLFGCTTSQLIKYIESKFKPGMSWDNYGYNGWHVDHIKPCAKFDLSKKSEQRKCFNYKNLQPLWKHENMSKSDIYE